MLSADNLTANCAETCDDWLCWPVTKAGENATLPCPKVKGTLENALAYKLCSNNGSWEVKRGSEGKLVNFTHYEACLIPKLQQLTEMCNAIGESECGGIAKDTRIIEMVGLTLSLISLIISLYIFFSYRILKNNRTKIHKNLFFATLFQVLFRLIKYVDQGLDDNNKFLSDTYYLHEVCTVLMEYSKTAMFSWMFIEGLYLHNVITVTVFQEYKYISFYLWCGWVTPAIMTAIWLAVMIIKHVQTTWEYYYFLPYYWILEGPRSFLIVINFLFLLNIIRVLVVKLRESRSSDIEQVRKAVRAAIFLLPLMGTAHILFLLDYQYTEPWKLRLWFYTSYFFNTFQGFFVAVLYCFLNGEVRNAVLRRNTSSRGFSSITMVGTDGKVHNVLDKFRWLNCCRRPPQSPEEKEIDLCDISEKRDRPTSITMVESVPMINKHAESNGFAVEHDDENTSSVKINCPEMQREL